MMKNLSIFLILFIVGINCDGLEISAVNTTDPFKMLGIPPFNSSEMLSSLESNEREIYKLDSLTDLPNFIKGGAYKTEKGIKMLMKFFSDDDTTIQENNGIMDISGFDGLSEQILSKGSESRNEQRARSTLNLWMKQKPKDYSQFEAYAAQKMPGQTRLFLPYNVIAMDTEGKTKILKVCLPKFEYHLLSFVVTDPAECFSKDKLSDDIENRSKAFITMNFKKCVSIT